MFLDFLDKIINIYYIKYKLPIRFARFGPRILAVSGNENKALLHRQNSFNFIRSVKKLHLKIYIYFNP